MIEQPVQLGQVLRPRLASGLHRQVARGAAVPRVAYDGVDGVGDRSGRGGERIEHDADTQLGAAVGVVACPHTRRPNLAITVTPGPDPSWDSSAKPLLLSAPQHRSGATAGAAAGERSRQPA